VVTCSDRDTVHVEDLRHIVGMDLAEVEGDDAGAPLRRRSVGDDAVDLGESFERVDEQLPLVLLDRGEADVREVVDGCAEATASAIGCVPASNLKGICPQVVSSSFTERIM